MPHKRAPGLTQGAAFTSAVQLAIRREDSRVAACCDTTTIGTRRSTARPARGLPGGRQRSIQATPGRAWTSISAATERLAASATRPGTSSLVATYTSSPDPSPHELELSRSPASLLRRCKLAPQEYGRAIAGKQTGPPAASGARVVPRAQNAVIAASGRSWVGSMVYRGRVAIP